MSEPLGLLPSVFWSLFTQSGDYFGSAVWPGTCLASRWEATITIRDIRSEVATNLEVEFGAQGLRALGFVSTAVDLCNVETSFSRKGELIAYAVREALNSVLDKSMSGTPWRGPFKEIKEAHDAWVTLSFAEREDERSSLDALSRSIRKMNEIYETKDSTEKQLVSVLLDRTGSAPSGQGMGLVEKYVQLLRAANDSLHVETTVNEAIEICRELVNLFELLFMPRQMRNNRLVSLSLIPAPTVADLEELRRLTVVPGHLTAFLSVLRDTAWLDLLKDSNLLDLPRVPTWWVGHSMVRALKDAYNDEVLQVLEYLYVKSDKGVEETTTIAHAARNAGMAARPLLQECLNRFPIQVSQIAIDSIEDGNASDDYVCDIASVILKLNISQSWFYLEPLFEAIEIGTNASNYLSRVKMLSEAVAMVQEPYRPWSIFLLQRGISIADESSGSPDEVGLRLLQCLTRAMQVAFPVMSADELTDFIVLLPEEVRARFAPWALSQLMAATDEELVSEVGYGLDTRYPSADDFLLLDRLHDSGGLETYSARIFSLIGEPPTRSEVKISVSTGNFPREWWFPFVWSSIIPIEVTGSWREAFRALENQYGVQSRQAILATASVEFGSVHSPFSLEELSQLSKEELLSKVRDWRPNPNDWTVSIYEFARILSDSMKNHLSVWISDPIQVIRDLVHPVYISEYVRLLTENTGPSDWNSSQFLELVQLLLSNPWETEIFDGIDRLDRSDPWQAVRSRAIEFLRTLARQDLDLGSEFGGLIDRLISIADSENSDGSIFDDGQNVSMIITESALALEAVLSVAVNDFRRTRNLCPLFDPVFSSLLEREGAIGDNFRWLVARNLSLFEGIASEWLRSKLTSIFTRFGSTEISDALLETALKSNAVYEPFFHTYQRGIWSAVKREVPSSAVKVMIAMLRNYQGYSIAIVTRKFKQMNKLSYAATALGRLASNSPDLPPEMLATIKQYWEASIEISRGGSLAGFGWFARCAQIADPELANLWLKTLNRSNDSLENSYQVSRRVREMVITTDILDILNLMVRRESDSLGRHGVSQVASEIIRESRTFDSTPEYVRLCNALQEREMI